MTSQQTTPKSAEIRVENVGGIDETSVAFEPGVTVLAGRNATNRTSLLQAIMAGLGSDDASIKADADHADIELTIDGTSYTRRLERRGNGVYADGDPYLEDPTLADLFAFLLESNEARRAVTTGADLRDIIMRPVDTDEIHSQIDALLERRREVTRKLDELDELKSRLPSLEERRAQLRTEIEETEAELRETEAELESLDANVQQSREEQAELEEKLAELRRKRSDLEDVRYELETEKDSVESLRSEKRERRAEYEDLPEAPGGKIDDVESRIDRLRTRKQQLESEISETQSVIRFNEEMLGDSSDAILDTVREENADAVTDQLLPDETMTCWTCGSEVNADQIETTVDRLRELSQSRLGEVKEINDELDELKEQKRDLREKQRRRNRLERQLTELETEIEETESRVDELADRRDELREEIGDIEDEIEAMEDDNSYSEILDLHKEANQFEYELGRLESELERVETNIEEIEERLDQESDLKARREEINEEIEEFRTRIERIERRAIEKFNDHMETVLDLLDYRNLERIWLERTETETRDGRRKVTKSTFDLHIVRKTDGGTTYEDTVDNLSESEREVTGLIFALAGYVAHEIHETVPFMLLDSLEAIDSERIASLVDYLREHSPYLVVALLPEDAAALSDEYRYVRKI